jgi:PKD repeat protein
VAYTWNFGDGTNTTQSTSTTIHTYTVANVYIVTLVVTDADGLTANATMTVPVYTSVPTHDVAIIAVSPSAQQWVRAVNGTTLTINVTAANLGTANETFDVSVYYGTNLLGKQTLTSMAPNTTQDLQFVWNTVGTPFGIYNITATASIVTDETNTTNNVLAGGQVIVTINGDVTGPNGIPDLKVDMRDIALVASAFGSNPITEPRHWNPICDINGDGKVDMRDIAIVAKEFGWKA